VANRRNGGEGARRERALAKGISRRLSPSLRFPGKRAHARLRESIGRPEEERQTTLIVAVCLTGPKEHDQPWRLSHEGTLFEEQVQAQHAPILQGKDGAAESTVQLGLHQRKHPR